MAMVYNKLILFYLFFSSFFFLLIYYHNRTFIIQGSPCVIIALIISWYLPNDIESARFLVVQERNIIMQKLKDGMQMHTCYYQQTINNKKSNRCGYIELWGLVMGSIWHGFVGLENVCIHPNLSIRCCICPRSHLVSTYSHIQIPF